jgi:cytochrome c556
VKGLTSLNVSSGVSALEAQVKKIQSNATKLVSQAKGDFPSQTQAIKSSVDSLVSSAKGLPSNPSAGQIASVAADASKVVSSVKGFTDATSSKCK